MPTKRDLYQELTDRILAKIAEGVAPWRRPWSSAKTSPAKNMATGHVYTGINFFILNFLSPYEVPYFASFKQVQRLKGKIRKGAKSERVYFYTKYYKDGNGKRISEAKAEKMGGTVECVQFLRYYNVFNVEDIEGIDWELPQVQLTPHQRLANCEAICANYPGGPEVVEEVGHEAFYNPARDVVNMPILERFDSPESYYVTLFHELAHSTGHAKRLGREGVTGDRAKWTAYGQEELIAEFSAAFLATHAGISCDRELGNNASYLSGWTNAIKADKKLIFKAAAAAQKATNYVLAV